VVAIPPELPPHRRNLKWYPQWGVWLIGENEDFIIYVKPMEGCALIVQWTNTRNFYDQAWRYADKDEAIEAAVFWGRSSFLLGTDPPGFTGYAMADVSREFTTNGEFAGEPAALRLWDRRGCASEPQEAVERAVLALRAMPSRMAFLARGGRSLAGSREADGFQCHD
jgi:hypothetical protein